MIKVDGHAVVLGASMGGLLAARVLADFYESVTVVERDLLPRGVDNRRGVPQGRHVHAILGRGCQVLTELFPGFADELTAADVPALDYKDLSKAYFCIGGHPSMGATHRSAQGHSAMFHRWRSRVGPCLRVWSGSGCAPPRM
jgi:2-polyprenyl-6-methoxyphenol hydroxylase-like FAD-dependent oxidoreductase